MNTHDEDIIQKLAELPLIAYERVRVPSAKGLDIRPALLDKLVKNMQQGTKNNKSIFGEPVELWHESVSPAEVLNAIAATISRFIVCPKEAVIAATLWAAMTWFIDVIQVAPLAVITAPEKRCGKSQLLFLLSQIVNRPLAASNISPAALFRSIHAWQPTLLIDEVDTFMRENEELRGLINAGHTRLSAYIYRVVGEDHIPTKFMLWGAKALAGIGKLNETIMDRAIILELRRKLPHEKVERLRHAEGGLFAKLAAKLARFSNDYSNIVRFAKPELPEVLNDRAQDNWEPLLAIADLAGEEWSQLARAAALKISGDADQSRSLGVELLADIEEVMESKKADRISTADLISDLCRDDEKPWATFNRGRPISPRQVAGRLKDFGIASNTIRLGTTTAKGYLFLQFADAFSRYLSSGNSSVTPSQASSDSNASVT